MKSKEVKEETLTTEVVGDALVTQESTPSQSPATLLNPTTKLHFATAFAGIEQVLVNQAKVNVDYKITDDLSYQTALTHNKTSASLEKKLEETKLAKTLPYRNVVGGYNSYAKDLLTKISNSRAQLGKKISDYEKADAIKKKAEADEKLKIAEENAKLEAKKQEDTTANLRNMAITMMDFIDKINGASTPEQLKEISSQLPKKGIIPEELQPFESIHEIYLKINSDCRTIGSLKFKALMAGMKAETPEEKNAHANASKNLKTAIDTILTNLEEYIDETEMEIVQESANKIAQTTMVASIHADSLTNSVARSTKSYSVSEIVVIDKTLIPLDWLTVDESAVKEYVKKNKLTKTTIVNGVQIVIAEKTRA